MHAFVTDNLDLLVGGLLVVAVGLVVAIVILLRRVARLSSRLDALTRGSDEGSLEAILGSHIERVRQVVRDVEKVAGRTTALEADIKLSLGRIGLVRYNPFEETGGNQSFALAVIDANGDGFVVSSLHARQATRVYGKAVNRGAAETALSDEESEALRQALARPVPGATR